MKLATKLFGAFLLVCALGAAISGIGIRNAGLINDAADTMYERELIGLSLIKDANADLLYVGRALRNALLAADETTRSQDLALVTQRMGELQARLDEARPLFTTDEGRAALVTADQQWLDYKVQAERVSSLAASSTMLGGTEASALLFGEFAQVSKRLDDTMTKLADIKEDNAKTASLETTAVYQTGRSTMLVLVVLALVLGLGAGFLLTRSVTRQLGAEPEAAVELARRVADGDLSTPIALRDGDTLSLMAAMRTMQVALSEVVSQVRDNAESVATASAQIAQGNADLSQRTEEQASALQQTAATMEQLSSTVISNADNSRQASQLAQSARGVAAHGGEVVGQVISTMKGIDQSSKRIAEIISVIDGIAFQTNILALNAAVEAARAGEQGRGFAVVAGEVRTLAHRSAEAAKEIKTLITDSVEQVDKGSSLVDQAGATMGEVVTAISRVADIAGEISAASQEQSTGVVQVNQAVSQMDQVTQQNAALVEESAAAADSLRAQARQLVDVVSVFKLDAAQAAAARSAGAGLAHAAAHTAAPIAAPTPADLARKALNKAKPAGTPLRPPAKAATTGVAHRSTGPAHTPQAARKASAPARKTPSPTVAAVDDSQEWAAF